MSEQDTRLLAEKLLDASYARIDALKVELAKARNAALEEAAQHINDRAFQMRSSGEGPTAHAMAMIFDEEANGIRALRGETR